MPIGVDQRFWAAAQTCGAPTISWGPGLWGLGDDLELLAGIWKSKKVRCQASYSISIRTLQVCHANIGVFEEALFGRKSHLKLKVEITDFVQLPHFTHEKAVA